MHATRLFNPQGLHCTQHARCGPISFPILKSVAASCRACRAYAVTGNALATSKYTHVMCRVLPCTMQTYCEPVYQKLSNYGQAYFQYLPDCIGLEKCPCARLVGAASNELCLMVQQSRVHGFAPARWVWYPSQIQYLQYTKHMTTVYIPQANRK